MDVWVVTCVSYLAKPIKATTTLKTKMAKWNILIHAGFSGHVRFRWGIYSNFRWGNHYHWVRPGGPSLFDGRCSGNFFTFNDLFPRIFFVTTWATTTTTTTNTFPIEQCPKPGHLLSSLSRPGPWKRSQFERLIFPTKCHVIPKSLSRLAIGQVSVYDEKQASLI